jgi:hypothetical protein
MVTQLVDDQVDVAGAGGGLLAEPLGRKPSDIEPQAYRTITVRSATGQGLDGRIVRPNSGGDGLFKRELTDQFRECPEFPHRRRDL